MWLQVHTNYTGGQNKHIMECLIDDKKKTAFAKFCVDNVTNGHLLLLTFFEAFRYLSAFMSALSN